MNISDIGLDIGQFAFIGGLILTLVRLWQAGKTRDKEMADRAAKDAVWKNTVELKMQQLTDDHNSVHEFMEEFRREVKDDHNKNVAHMDQKFIELRNDVIEVRQKGETGREKLYDEIKELRNRIK